MEVLAYEYRVPFSDDANVLKLGSDDGCATLKTTELYILKG